MKCLFCEIGMITETAWRKLTLEERTATGMRPHSSFGLCSRCYYRERYYHGRQVGEARQRSREEVLEDWDFLRSDGVTDLALAAKRMGMTKAALQKALERARKAGDSRAVVRRNGDLGGIAQGTTGMSHYKPTGSRAA